MGNRRCDWYGEAHLEHSRERGEENKRGREEKRTAQQRRQETVSSDKKSDKKSDTKWTHLFEVEVCRKAVAGYDHAGWRYVW
jgi:hypothetical protein